MFVDIWTGQWWSVDELNGYCKSVVSILKKYWHKIHDNQVRAIIEKYDSSLLSFIDVLYRAHKLSLKEIQHIQSLLEADLQQPLTVRTSHPELITQDDDLQLLPQETIWLTVVGDGHVYKRSLHTDLKTLLK